MSLLCMNTVAYSNIRNVRSSVVMLALYVLCQLKMIICHDINSLPHIKAQACVLSGHTKDTILLCQKRSHGKPVKKSVI